MIHQILFYKLQPQIDEAGLEEMMRTSRSILLKIPEVLSVKSGRSIDQESEWPFFINLEFENLEKKRIAEDDPVYLKFQKVVLEKKVSNSFQLEYELDPSKDLKYS